MGDNPVNKLDEDHRPALPSGTDPGGAAAQAGIAPVGRLD